MRNYPIYILGGGAGSGKDTVASMMLEERHGITIAQADPMKRFTMEAFGFSEEQLWGPSEMRNAEDARFKADAFKEFEAAEDRIFYGDENHDEALLEPFLNDVMGISNGYWPLKDWFDRLKKEYGAGSGKVLTPRACLQLLGTEFGRRVDPDVWSRIAIHNSNLLLRGGFRYSRTTGLKEEASEYGYDFTIITDGRFRNEILNVKTIGGCAYQIVNPVEDRRGEEAGVKNHASEMELKRIPQSWYDYVLINDKTQGLDTLRANVHAVLRPR